MPPSSPTADPAVAERRALEQALAQRHDDVESALRAVMPRTDGPVGAAVEDSLFAPAKRLRPILSLLVAEALRGDPRSIAPGACAVELVHTASLILDDLPCMDDAATRRGRPSCHVVHGEATAILAAFALQNRAFELLAAGWPGAPDDAARSAIARELAQAVGLDGMITGQSLDLEMTGRTPDLATLEVIHSRKTGALFMASAALGARAAQASPSELAALRAYAKNLGLAFQVVDDIIDATVGAAEAGKDVGKDAAKTTFVTFCGVDGARALATELVAASEEALTGLGRRGRTLRELARYVLARRR